MPPPPPSVALMDDLVEEVFFRLPPDEPAYLVRASLVCKPWRRILADPAFRRRYRKFHRTPPLMGLFQREEVFYPSRFVPTSAFLPAGPVRTGWSVIDCRHGRVLCVTSYREMMTREFVVWDPVTDKQSLVPRPSSTSLEKRIPYTAAVLCATQGCDHLCCNGKPFRVALLTTDWTTGWKAVTSAYLYSSETGAWSEHTSVHHSCGYVQMKPSVLVGDALYFCLYGGYTIEYQLGAPRLSVISPPGKYTRESIVLMSNEDGLGCATVDISNTSLYLVTMWSCQNGPNGIVEWAQRKVINLKTLLPNDAISTSPLQIAFLSGSAEGTQIIFVATNFNGRPNFKGVYLVELKSGRARKVLHDCRRVYPYMSFYIPEMEAASAGEPQKVGA